MTKTRIEIKEIIAGLDEMLSEEQRKVESKITRSAPQSFNDDMNGCARGIFMARNMAIHFLEKKLLSDKDE